LYFDVISIGGPILIIILAIAGIGLFFFVERFIVLAAIKSAIRKGDDEQTFLIKVDRRLSAQKGARADEIHEIISLMVERLTRNFRFISTAITVAPLLGLLGTVTGMVKIFNSLDKTENLKYAGQLATGIGEALYTTIAGLIVAITLTILLNVIKEMVTSIENELTDIYLKAPVTKGLM
jgi:biopolymer transport protein ExbB/TolQ